MVASCNKEETSNEINTAEDMTLIEDVLNSIEETVDETTFGLTGDIELETRVNPCVEITSTAPLGEFPNTFTLDFGDGCEGPNGRIRKGIMTIEITDQMENDGAARTVTFTDFYLDNVQILGSRITTNTGVNDAGQQTFSREIVGIQLIFPNGDVASRDASHLLTYLEGFDTQARWDNIVSITGTSSGVSRAGVTYSSVIVEQLIKRANCRWITEGIREITRDGQTASLNYGDGACNRAAVVTFEDGTTKEINLYRKWW